MLVRRWWQAACLVVLVWVGTTAGRCQQMTLAKVEFKNPGPFGQADLEAVAAMHPGQHVVLKDIQAAAQRLVDTGCFDDVHVDSHGATSALTLVFLLKPSVSGDLHEVTFDNVVWLTPEELRAAVHASAPLFGGGGRLPETSGVLDAISASLAAALAAKGIAGAEVEHELELATSARPVSLIRFRVEQPKVLVGTVALTGDGPELGASRTLAGKLRGRPYHAGARAGSTAEALLAPYLDAGYVDAELRDEALKVEPGANGATEVDLAARIESGAAYRVGAVRLSGSPVVSAEAFAADATVHPGDVASRRRLLESEQRVDKAYHKLGYMDAYVEAVPTRDEATHTISYVLHAVPGEIYRVHSTAVEGLSPEAKAQFDLAWKLHPGELYNADYIRDFLANNTAVRALIGYAGSFQAAADPVTRLVDVTVNFVPTTAGSWR